MNKGFLETVEETYAKERRKEHNLHCISAYVCLCALCVHKATSHVVAVNVW